MCAGHYGCYLCCLYWRLSVWVHFGELLSYYEYVVIHTESRGNEADDIAAHCGTLEAVHFENNILIVNCVLDVFTDMCSKFTLVNLEWGF